MSKEIWYFYADWCTYCQKQNPIMDEFEAENPDVQITRIHEERDRDAVEHNNIKGFPTLVFFKNGQSIKTTQGLNSKKELEKVFA